MSPVVQPVVTSVFMLYFQHVQEIESNAENNNKILKITKNKVNVISCMREENQLSVKKFNAKS
jgi:hypothetical protein